jgi:hypothetical protein
MRHPILLASLIISSLAACEMQAPPPAAPPPPQNVILPAATPTALSESSSTTTTVQGNTTRTVTESSSVSVNAGGLLGGLLGSAPVAANTANDYAGQWRVTSPENKECRVNLLRPATPTAQANAQMQGCFGDLFGITRWSLRGSELVLSDAFGQKQISLRATGANRLDGGGVTMWR